MPSSHQPSTHSPSVGLAAWAGQMGGMATSHKHYDLELNLLLQGACEYDIAGQNIVVPEGRLFALWGATPHRSIRLAEDTFLIWTTVSLANVLSWSLKKRFLHSLLKQGWAVDREANEIDEPMMRRWVDDLGSGGDAAHRIVLLELQARLLRLATSAIHVCKSQHKSNHTEAIDESKRVILNIERYISEHFREAITVKDIATSIKLHPNYVMSLFQKHTGQTLINTVTQHRIAYCLHQLALTDTPILDISLDAGFGSTSRFYEAFGREVGCSPSQYRQRIRSAK